jgi:hypothetical protein
MKCSNTNVNIIKQILPVELLLLLTDRHIVQNVSIEAEQTERLKNHEAESELKE